MPANDMSDKDVKNPEILRAIWNTICANRTFFITGHANPDGDTVGSELALLSLLSRIGKKAVAANAYRVPESFSFLPRVQRIRTARPVSGTYDVAIILECSSPERMGGSVDLDRQIKKAVINIDHHASGRKFADVNLVDPMTSSNSEQVYDLFNIAGMKPTKYEAACLYVGLVTDTGCFKYSNTTPHSHHVAASLIRLGVDVARINNMLFNTRSLKFLKTLARALNEIEIVNSGRIAFLTLAANDLCNESDEVVNYGLMLPGVRVAALFKPGDEKQKVKISLRSKDNINTTLIAKQFGGGGHRNASGCTIDGSFEQAKKRVLAAIKDIVG